MRAAALMAALVLAGPGGVMKAVAEDWRPVGGQALRDLLGQKDIRFDSGAEQLFFLGGITRFSHGWPNEGRWKVVGDEYCSQWPPDMAWHCMGVLVAPDGTHVRFEDAAHQVWQGEIAGVARWPG